MGFRVSLCVDVAIVIRGGRYKCMSNYLLKLERCLLEKKKEIKSYRHRLKEKEAENENELQRYRHHLQENERNGAEKDQEIQDITFSYKK